MPSNQNFRKTLLVLFIGIEACMLVWWLFRLDGQYDNEDFLFFQVLLGAIGFPSTAAGLVLISLADLLVPIFAGHTKLAACANLVGTRISGLYAMVRLGSEVGAANP